MGAVRQWALGYGSATHPWMRDQGHGRRTTRGDARWQPRASSRSRTRRRAIRLQVFATSGAMLQTCADDLGLARGRGGLWACSSPCAERARPATSRCHAGASGGALLRLHAGFGWHARVSPTRSARGASPIPPPVTAWATWRPCRRWSVREGRDETTHCERVHRCVRQARTRRELPANTCELSRWCARLRSHRCLGGSRECRVADSAFRQAAPALVAASRNTSPRANEPIERGQQQHAWHRGDHCCPQARRPGAPAAPWTTTDARGRTDSQCPLQDEPA